MNPKISLFYNPETDDLFAVIIQDGKCFCYSHIGQHSSISKEYLMESVPAPITVDSVDLYLEIKEAYKDTNPDMCEQYEIINIIQNEQIKFTL